ncbi:MAG: hypothetical protein ABII01_06125 [Candidatus Woesearchaeota archaeon]
MKKGKMLKNIAVAKDWLGAEHDSLNNVIELLSSLQEDIQKINTPKERKDVRRARRQFAYAGRSERNVDRYEKKVEEGLREIEAHLANPRDRLYVENLLQQIRVAASTLVKLSSRYSGKLKTDLERLSKDIDKQDLEDAQNAMQMIQQEVVRANEWMSSLAKLLDDAGRLASSERIAA